MDQKQRNRILSVLFIGVLMGALDIAIVGPALPAIQKAFAVSDRALTWMFSIYVLFNLIGTPLMAKLSDIYGRRMIYVVDVSVFAVGSLIVALSPSFGVVVIGRAIQGLGAGGIFPVASAVIGDIFPPEKRGSALGLIGAVFGVAFIVGPIIGGLLLMASWHWLFIVNLPIAAVVIWLSLRILPANRPNRVARFDWPGMIVLSTGLAALALGINQLDTKNIGASLLSLTGLPLFLLAGALLVVFVSIERRAASPVVRLDLFSRRQMVLTYLLSSGAGLGEASLVFMPNMAVVAFGLKTSEAAFLLMPVVLAMAVGSPLVGRLLDKFGSRLVILSGTVILVGGLFLIGVAGARMPMFILSGALIGLGLAALLGAPMRYIMLNEASRSDRSVAQGIVALFASVGQLVGSALVGAVADSQGGGVGGYESAFLVTAVIGVVMVLLATGLKNRQAELATVRSNEEKSAIQPGSIQAAH
jgi:EmrB/QacA subfamily drug resistance transporter